MHGGCWVQRSVWCKLTLIRVGGSIRVDNKPFIVHIACYNSCGQETCDGQRILGSLGICGNNRGDLNCCMCPDPSPAQVTPTDIPQSSSTSLLPTYAPINSATAIPADSPTEQLTATEVETTTQTATSVATTESEPTLPPSGELMEGKYPGGIPLDLTLIEEWIIVHIKRGPRDARTSLIGTRSRHIGDSERS